MIPLFVLKLYVTLFHMQWAQILTCTCAYVIFHLHTCKQVRVLNAYTYMPNFMHVFMKNLKECGIVR